MLDNLDSLTVDRKGEKFTEQGVKDLISFTQSKGLTVKDTVLSAVPKLTLFEPEILNAVRACIGVDHEK